jgi:hypothetical protein
MGDDDGRSCSTIWKNDKRIRNFSQKILRDSFEDLGADGMII